jgi:hypothetical protein
LANEKNEENEMTTTPLISAQQAYQRAKSGEALLVCAYENDEKFARFQLEGAIPLSEFQKKIDSIDPGTEIIFYCA